MLKKMWNAVRTGTLRIPKFYQNNLISQTTTEILQNEDSLKNVIFLSFEWIINSLVDPGGTTSAHPSPRVPIFSFWHAEFTKQEILDPPLKLIVESLL